MPKSVCARITPLQAGVTLVNLERWRRVDKIFHYALEREPCDRAALLDDACAGDPSLRKEVEALIDSHEQAGSFLKLPTSTPALIDRTFGSYEVRTLIGSG